MGPCLDFIILALHEKLNNVGYMILTRTGNQELVECKEKSGSAQLRSLADLAFCTMFRVGWQRYDLAI
jgi:hypothetical protein